MKIKLVAEAVQSGDDRGTMGNMSKNTVALTWHEVKAQCPEAAEAWEAFVDDIDAWEYSMDVEGNLLAEDNNFGGTWYLWKDGDWLENGEPH